MSRGQTLLALIAAGIGTLIAGILGLFAYMTATATPLHPSAPDVPSVSTAAPSKKWADAVAAARQLARTGIVEQNLPGLSIAVGVDGDVAWAEGFGWADLESRTRVAPDTRFRTGGISMALTSAAVGKLLENHRLELDDEIRKHVRAFPAKEWPVTLRQLMGHLGGIRSDEGDEEPLLERCDQTTDGMRRFADGRLLFQPGTRFHYSSYGWVLVSAAVDAAAGQLFFDYMRTQIFAPLEMSSTTVDSTSDPPRERATPYHPRFAADTRYGPETVRDGDYSCFAGGGAFLSTPSDLVRFGMAVNGGKLLRPATVTLLQTPQRLASGEETAYGLGWDLRTVPFAGQPTKMAGHDSRFAMGASGSLATFPERGIAVAVMTNTGFARTADLATGIAQAFAQQTRPPSPK